MAIILSDNGNVEIRIAYTGHEGQTDSWTVSPHFNEDPTLEGFSKTDRAMVNELSISVTEASGNTDLDKKANAIDLLIKNLKEVHLSSREYRNLVVSKIETDDSALAKLLEQEHGIKDKGREQVVSSEAKG